MGPSGARGHGISWAVTLAQMALSVRCGPSSGVTGSIASSSEDPAGRGGALEGFASFSEPLLHAEQRSNFSSYGCEERQRRCRAWRHFGSPKQRNWKCKAKAKKRKKSRKKKRCFNSTAYKTYKAPFPEPDLNSYAVYSTQRVSRRR